MRTLFRESVFKRDNYKCVMCGDAAVDAHHILERRLFCDGGYHIDNGASLCATCHLKAESTEISPQILREKIGIKTPYLPDDFYRDLDYDKWGNIYLPNGTRSIGPLFYDESVQKVIKPFLPEFREHVKYPRTYHLPWSNTGKDDRMLPDVSQFLNKWVVVTEKMDGENTSIYPDGYVHARSLDSKNHDSRDYVKRIAGRLAGNIPDRWRVCGENLYALHSINYQELADYFLAFSIWDENNTCLSWDKTVEWCELLEIKHVNVLYEGEFNEKIIKSLWNESMDEFREGYVVRLYDSFHYKDFSKSIAKFVRPNHVRTAHGFFRRQVIPNQLKK